MTVPIWALLGFATWTLMLLLLTVGVYRWSLIVAGRVSIRDFPADGAGGADWYKRATRAHANCIENLPVFGAIVLALHASHVSGSIVDLLATTVLAARDPVARACVLHALEHDRVHPVHVLLRAVRLLRLADRPGRHRAPREHLKPRAGRAIVRSRTCRVRFRTDSRAPSRKLPRIRRVTCGRAHGTNRANARAGIPKESDHGHAGAGLPLRAASPAR